MAKQKQIGLLTLCERVRKPDMQRIAELTMKARGGRTSVAFADDCGLAPSTITRLLKGDFKRSISEDVIAAVAVNSEDRSTAWFKAYLDAYGVELPAARTHTEEEVLPLYEDFFEQVKQQYTLSRRTMENPVPEVTQRQEDILQRNIDILLATIARKGGAITFLQDQDALKGKGVPIRADFVISTDALSAEHVYEWAFRIDTTLGGQFIHSITDIAQEAYFARPAEKGYRYTVITNDLKTYYQTRLDLQSHYSRAYDSISVMYIDLRAGAVGAEFVIPRDTESVRLFSEGKDAPSTMEVYGVPDDGTTVWMSE